MAVETEEELAAKASSKEDSKDDDKTPSNDELSDAFDKLFKEEEELVSKDSEMTNEDAKIVDDEKTQDDNAEKSRLGRKVKAMEEERKKDRELLEKILAKLDSPKQTVAKTNDNLDSDEEEEYPTEIKTPDDIENYNRIKAQREAKALRTYQTTYRNLVESYAKDDDYAEVLEVLKTNPEFDKIHTGKPEIDVEINYNKAARSLLAKRLKASAEKKVPVHGNDETPPAGLSGTNRVAKPFEKEYELDEFAREFVNKTKMSKEDIGKALAGDIPLNLRGAK